MPFVICSKDAVGWKGAALTAAPSAAFYGIPLRWFCGIFHVSTAVTSVVQLFVDDDQAQLIRESSEPIVIVDRTGSRIGILDRDWTPEELAEAERLAHSDGPWTTTQEVVASFRSLGSE